MSVEFVAFGEVPTETRKYQDRSLVLEELSFIEKRDGVVTPEAVVEFAKDETTQLHGQFNWDDGEAAHQWRLFQARQVIRAMVTILPNGNEDVVTKAYVHIVETSRNPTGYIEVRKVLSDEEYRKQMLNTAHRELKTFRKKYAHLKELAALFDVIDSL